MLAALHANITTMHYMAKKRFELIWGERHIAKSAPLIRGVKIIIN